MGRFSGIAALAVGVVLGATAQGCGQALAGQFWPGEAQHYLLGWKVLVHGQEVCGDPYIRPSDREIECRSAR